MSRCFLPLAVCALGLLVAGCPDLYPRVKDVEFEGWTFVSRPGKNPFAHSPVIYPKDFHTKPRSSGDYKVDDPVSAKALLAGGSAGGAAPAPSYDRITVREGPSQAWIQWWLERRGRVKVDPKTCPYCHSPLCNGNPCMGYGPGMPNPADREAWKRHWRSRGQRADGRVGKGHFRPR